MFLGTRYETCCLDLSMNIYISGRDSLTISSIDGRCTGVRDQDLKPNIYGSNPRMELPDPS